MTALVLPFPRSRDRGFILRHAGIMAGASTTRKAEGHLQRQLTIQHETLVRRGVAPVMVDAELRTIENNIRAARWRFLLAPGGAA
ncbi:DUF6074 family protein [Methylobacterium nigriterrae]|uniref:DUF6074 family protein n=1 Tax=Methylobacterium nigriterrae TaxID=3127512 RepID=UPI003013D706